MHYLLYTFYLKIPDLIAATKLLGGERGLEPLPSPPATQWRRPCQRFLCTWVIVSILRQLTVLILQRLTSQNGEWFGTLGMNSFQANISLHQCFELFSGSTFFTNFNRMTSSKFQNIIFQTTEAANRKCSEGKVFWKYACKFTGEHP